MHLEGFWGHVAVKSTKHTHRKPKNHFRAPYNVENKHFCLT